MTGNELSIRVNESGGSIVVEAEGELDLSNAGQLRDVLRKSISPLLERDTSVVPRTVMVDVGGITAIDLCGLQLLCSAHRTHQARQIKFELQGATTAFRQTAREAGFLVETSHCPYRKDSGCLWRE